MDIQSGLTHLNEAERAALNLRDHTDEEEYSVGFIDGLVSQALADFARTRSWLEQMQGEDVPLHAELGRAMSDYAILLPHEATLHQMAGVILRHQIDAGF